MDYQRAERGVAEKARGTIAKAKSPGHWIIQSDYGAQAPKESGAAP